MSKHLRQYILEEVEALYKANQDDFEQATDRIMARLFNPQAQAPKVTGPSTKKRSYDSLGDLAQSHNLILNTIQVHGPLSRQQLADYTGLKLCSVTPRVRELLDNSFLCVLGRIKDEDSGKEVETLAIVEIN